MLDQVAGCDFPLWCKTSFNIFIAAYITADADISVEAQMILFMFIIFVSYGS
jgi:hypothetical protein